MNSCLTLLDEDQQVDKLIALFEQLFLARYQTRLVAGGEEPIYLPASRPGASHQIVFTRNYFSSALHELAHWCVAGPERRQLEDYGYWYVPDGRSPEQQRAFEQVEVRPQAYEQCFAWACGRRFHISADNLSGDPGSTQAFEYQVHQMTYALLFKGQLKNRAQELFEGICQAWQNPLSAWQEEARSCLETQLARLSSEIAGKD